MLKLFLILSLIITGLFSLELAVVGDKNFPENNLSKQSIKAIFLDKKRFIGESKVLVMNHEHENPLRICFEEKILEKSEKSLERYWRKAYYQGKRPPKIVSSNEMLFLYLQSVQPSIGYVDFNATLDKELTVLYRVGCEE